MRAQHQQQQQPQQQFQQMVKNFYICIAEMNRIDTITNENIGLNICMTIWPASIFKLHVSFDGLQK